MFAMSLAALIQRSALTENGFLLSGIFARSLLIIFVLCRKKALGLLSIDLGNVGFKGEMDFTYITFKLSPCNIS